MINLSKIFVSLFYIGFFPFASGTFASFISILIIYFLFNIFSQLLMISLFFFIFFLSILFIKNYSKNLEVKDAKEIVIDEFIGIFLIMIFYKYLNFASELTILLSIFIFFRIFDIFKPFPANWIDKNMNNEFGVLFDDIVAGFYSLILLFILNVFL